MLTLCWAAKGGSGTTVVAATLALSADDTTWLVDLDGDLPTVLGVGRHERTGVHDWLRAGAAAERLRALAEEVTPTVRLLPCGRTDGPATPRDPQRWIDLADALAALPGDVVVDTGRQVPGALLAVADRTLLITRPCYLAIEAARSGPRPSGIVLIDEPGRALRPADVERAIGAPVVAELLVDPMVARAVDAGLLTSRLPRPFRRRLEDAA
jgi:hypothetical protein